MFVATISYPIIDKSFLRYKTFLTERDNASSTGLQIKRPHGTRNLFSCHPEARGISKAFTLLVTDDIQGICTSSGTPKTSIPSLSWMLCRYQNVPSFFTCHPEARGIS